MDEPTLDIEMLRRGDAATTQQLLDILRRAARRYVNSDADAESVAGEVLLELLVRLDDGASEQQLGIWLRSAPRNAARRILHRQRKVAVEFVSELHSGSLPATMSEIQRWRRLLAGLHETIATMPTPTQHAIVATAVDGRTVESVAKELGVPASTLRNTLSRARDKFRRELTGAEKFDRLCEFAKLVRQARSGSSSAPPAWSSRRSSDSSVTSS